MPNGNQTVGQFIPVDGENNKALEPFLCFPPGTLSWPRRLIFKDAFASQSMSAK
jgi:hypothetical protein